MLVENGGEKKWADLRLEPKKANSFTTLQWLKLEKIPVHRKSPVTRKEKGNLPIRVKREGARLTFILQSTFKVEKGFLQARRAGFLDLRSDVGIT